MEIYRLGDSAADTVLVQPVDEHDMEFIENEAADIADRCDRSFCLIAAKVDSWNRDLSPWEAPAVFGKGNFGSGASGTLDELLNLCDDKSRTYYIGGYSLAGLFALWAVYQTDRFEGVAAASPSMWFPGFVDYMKDHEIKSGAVYLSLGTKEEKARNPVMAAVGDRIREAEELLKEHNVNSILEWNEGNHFREPDIRTAKAFAWLVNKSYSL